MSRIQKVLAGLIVVFLLLHFIDVGDASERNYEFMPDMVESPAYEAQDENPNFADGKTLQPPVPGTIARGFLPLHTGDATLVLGGIWKDLTPAQQKAWDGLKPPASTKPWKPDARRGEAVFQTVCATCHGGAGAGDGAVTKRGVPPPPSLLSEGPMKMSDGRMFRAITCGEGNMPSHAAQVLRKDRWEVIAFVRGLQKP